MEDIDAWDLHRDGDWLVFSARMPGRQGARSFRRPLAGGAIIADAPGPVYGILGLGGARAALANDQASEFPQHILAPADDIGAVGHAGVERAAETAALEPLREMTHEALVAETLLSWQLEKFAALPLFVVRAETDTATSAAELGRGEAYENLLVAAANLSRAAASLGKDARIKAVTLDFALEDQGGDALAYRDGMLALMRRIEEGLARLGYDRPLFLARMESGTAELTGAAAIEGQWELAWNHGDHRLIFSAPGYMFALDEHDRPTPEARREMAEMSAAALAEGDGWHCPRFHLAELLPDEGMKAIRVVARAMGDLVIDAEDPLGAGKARGFALHGAENAVKITSVDHDPKDAQSLILRLDKAPKGSDLRLAYAYGAKPRPGAYPANCGAVRDGWSHIAATGRLLHRWALPCLLPVHPGGGADAGA
ncbi:MAG: hypothetical protein R3D84_11935 [Paracoccaceae bacterium]